MPDQRTPDQTPDEASSPTSPDQVRAALHAVVEQLSNEAALALWRFVQAWIASASRRPQRGTGE